MVSPVVTSSIPIAPFNALPLSPPVSGIAEINVSVSKSSKPSSSNGSKRTKSTSSDAPPVKRLKEMITSSDTASDDSDYDPCVKMYINKKQRDSSKSEVDKKKSVKDKEPKNLQQVIADEKRKVRREKLVDHYKKSESTSGRSSPSVTPGSSKVMTTRASTSVTPSGSTATRPTPIVKSRSTIPQRPNTRLLRSPPVTTKSDETITSKESAEGHSGARLDNVSSTRRAEYRGFKPSTSTSSSTGMDSQTGNIVVRGEQLLDVRQDPEPERLTASNRSLFHDRLALL